MEVLSHIFKQSIESSDVFSQYEDIVEYIIPMLEMKVFLPEDMIVRQGEEGREMYFISTGDCIVLVKDTKRQEKAVRKLTRGDFFGVSKLFFDLLRRFQFVQTVEEQQRLKAKTIASPQC